jgi:hypothetical protein
MKFAGVLRQKKKSLAGARFLSQIFNILNVYFFIAKNR